MTVMTEDSTEKSTSTKYDLVPLNPELASHLPGLGEALLSGSLLPDSKRKGFFELLSGVDWFYVHISQATSTVYLVAHRISSF